jgi:hypothetical protein
MPISSESSRTSLGQAVKPSDPVSRARAGSPLVAFATACSAVKVSLTKPIYRFEAEGHDVPSPQGQQ